MNLTLVLTVKELSALMLLIKTTLEVCHEDGSMNKNLKDDLISLYARLFGALSNENTTN